MELQVLLHNLEKIIVQLRIARRYNEDDMALLDISDDLSELIAELRLEEKEAEKPQVAEEPSKPSGKEKFQAEIEQDLRRMGILR